MFVERPHTCHTQITTIFEGGRKGAEAWDGPAPKMTLGYKIIARSISTVL